MNIAWRGVVLAGGESRRMGRDKALLIIDGESLWRRQVRLLREAGAADVAVVRAPDQSALSDDVPHLRDSVRNAGPLAGLHAALTANGAPLVAVLAVDLANIEAGWFRHLLSFCRAERGAVAQHSGGFEPLAAFYPRAALPLIERRLAGDNRALQPLVATLLQAQLLAAVPVADDKLGPLANWNSPSDIVAAPV